MIQLLISLFNLIFKKKAPALIIPAANPNDILVHEAQDWVGIIDNADHTKAEINRFRLAVNNSPNGENWCADFVIFCIEQVESKLNVVSPLSLHSELAQDLFWKSPVSCRTTTPFPGCIIVWRHGDTGLGHCGIVEAVAADGTMTTIEGNTGPGVGIVRDGGGVFRRFRTKVGTPAMLVLGFLKPFNT